MATTSRIISGRLDRRVSLYEQRASKDRTGGPIVRLYPIAHVWASVSIVSGQLVDGVSEQRTSEASALMVLRYRSDITQKALIGYQGEAYDILSVSEIGRREGVELAVRRTRPHVPLPAALIDFQPGKPLIDFDDAAFVDFDDRAILTTETDESFSGTIPLLDPDGEELLVV